MIELITVVLGLLMTAAKFAIGRAQEAKQRAADPVEEIREFDDALAKGDEQVIQNMVADWANRGRVNAHRLPTDPPPSAGHPG